MDISLYCIQGAPPFPPQKTIRLIFVRLGSLPRPRWSDHHRKRPWVSVCSYSGHHQQEVQPNLRQLTNTHCLKKYPRSPIFQLYDAIITRNKTVETKISIDLSYIIITTPQHNTHIFISNFNFLYCSLETNNIQLWN